MKRILFLLAVAALALPATALAKGPSEAKITGPGLGKAITVTGPESEGSPLMTFAEHAGFFPAAFGPEPHLPQRQGAPTPPGSSQPVDSESSCSSCSSRVQRRWS